ncbi:metal ABC transporter permease [Iodidimonas nitroreducens]|uniref:Metal ABC transporter permease n=1 Tax=Iodidimonas nitroreducens TaxID=1236968 RepID=A0A5A7N3I0_9PROT|nr:ABC transporter ATP-binding protein/permease [Iodidimonas nitroreducens]GAK34065.1 ABC transporter B family member 25, mitochondrial [alpha proteobacterium Q-1]GER02832.1 metal ABC transporter permease [Iodidimonas nitroreducens]
MPRGLQHSPIDSTGPKEPTTYHWQSIRRLIPYLWPRDRFDLKLRIVFAVLLMLLAKGVTVYTPFFYKSAIDNLQSPTGQAVLIPAFLLMAYGMARFGGVALAQLRDAVFSQASQHALRSVALQTFQHLHALSLRFHLERRTGGMSRAIDRGTRAIDFLLRFLTFNIVPTVLELLLVAGIFWVHFGWIYALCLLVAVAIYIVFSVAITEWRTRFRKTMNEQDSKANSRAIDSLLNYETVKYFGNEEHEANRYDRALKSYQGAALQSQSSLSLLNAGQALIINIALAGVMILTARDALAGTLTLGDVVLANSLLIQLFVPLNLLGFVYREIRQSLIDMDYLFGLLDRDQEIADKVDAVPLVVKGGEVRFQAVDFGYDPRRQILHDLSFHVPPGKTVAIVGPSGAGKSTLSRILYRFYDITAGAVLIDGMDIRDVTQKSLRQAIGIVPQDTVLFNESIAYNIRYGRPDASDEDIRQAARFARIDGFIDQLPDGYETLVGERGLKLSGGEKQRVAIARTILKDPPILLLDEATSALDSRTEREIQEAIEQISRNRTTLVIAHRLSTVVNADEILVLDQGRIIERGAHESLLLAQGTYHAMWQRQLDGSPSDV